MVAVYVLGLVVVMGLGSLVGGVVLGVLVAAWRCYENKCEWGGVDMDK